MKLIWISLLHNWFAMDKAKEEYFELLRQLNKSNKTTNEVTKLSFIVENSDKYQGVLYASISKDQKVLLCTQSDKILRPAGYSGYDDLETFICNIVKSIFEQNITEIILRNLFS